MWGKFGLNVILEHQLNKSLESFDPCYSQSPLQADFKENTFKKSAKLESEKTQVYA
jgi:hypothetical protein